MSNILPLGQCVYVPLHRISVTFDEDMETFAEFEGGYPKDELARFGRWAEIALSEFSLGYVAVETQ